MCSFFFRFFLLSLSYWVIPLLLLPLVRCFFFLLFAAFLVFPLFFRASFEMNSHSCTVPFDTTSPCFLLCRLFISPRNFLKLLAVVLQLFHSLLLSKLNVKSRSNFLMMKKISRKINFYDISETRILCAFRNEKSHFPKNVSNFL